MSNTERKIHKLGFIGTGGRGRLLARCVQLDAPDKADMLHRQLRGLPSPVQWRSEILAAADPVAESRQKAAVVLPSGCPVHEDPPRVVEHPEVEVVVIATTSIFHVEWAVAAMEAGKDVICDKPMATTLEHCDQICDAVQRTGRIFGLSMQNRYSYCSTASSAASSRRPTAGGAARVSSSAWPHSDPPTRRGPSISMRSDVIRSGWRPCRATGPRAERPRQVRRLRLAIDLA